MINQNLTDSSKALVRSFYEGGTNSEAKTYGQIFHPEFKVTAPDYLPWGGTSDLESYLEDVLPKVTKVLDFSRCKIVSLIGENSSVVIIIDIGLLGTPQNIQISEHWEIKNARAISLWVAYFEPRLLIELIDRNKLSSIS